MAVTMTQALLDPQTFALDADHLALDFLNTGEGSDGARVERLASPAQVLAWLTAAGVATPEDAANVGATLPEARILLTEAHRLRDALDRAIGAWAGGTLVPDVALLEVDRVMGARTEACRLVRTGGVYAVRVVAASRNPLGLLAPVAIAAATLLADGDPARVRRCDAAACGLWLLDTSKNGSRRWCSMARCGNRAKVAAHKRRRRGPGAGGGARTTVGA
jgi:predicted RNA-binding Zn ribbon-like protein